MTPTRRRALPALLILAAALTLTACGGGASANPAACKSAMAKAYASALASPSGTPAAEPPACKGVPAATVSRYATQIIGGQG